MNQPSRLIPGLAAAAAVLLGAVAVRAETRETSVPNNYASVYVGFNKMSNTDIRTTGNDASWFGGTSGKSFTMDFKNAQMKNTVWGGMAFGHWFTQVPFSIGMQGNLDFFPAAVKEQKFVDPPFVVNGVLQPGQTFTKYQTDIFQMVPSVNLVGGVPLKFARVYGGIGPGLFASFYSFTLKNSAGRSVGSVSAADAKIGYNAFFGADFFISRRWSAFVEAKYSEVHDLSFTPDPNSSLMAGRKITETYSSLTTQRLAVGASYHF